MNIKKIIQNIFSIRNKDKYKEITIFGRKKYIYSTKNELRIAKNTISMQKMFLSFCDITKCKKAEGKLRKIQLICLKAFAVVAKVLEDNNLQYWLDSGVLLGAVRHKGFIPWDNDIDIVISGEDYYKAIDVLKKEFQDTIFKIGVGDYGRSFILRVSDKNFDFYYIDIFPYMYSNNDKLSKDEIADLVFKATTKFYEKYPKKYLYKNPQIYHEKKSEIFDMYKQYGITTDWTKGKYLFRDISNSHSFLKIIHDVENVFPLRKLSFEGYEFNAPNNPIEYLKEIKCYGDIFSFPDINGHFSHAVEEKMCEPNYYTKILESEKEIDNLMQKYGIKNLYKDTKENEE